MLHTSGHFSYEVLRASRRDSSAVHCPALPYIVGRWVPGGPFPLHSASPNPRLPGSSWAILARLTAS